MEAGFALGTHLGIALFAGLAGGADSLAVLLGGDVSNADGVGHGGFFAFVFGVGEFGHAGTGFDDSVSENADDELDGARGVVVGRNGEVNDFGIVVGVAEGEDRDVELAGFESGVLLKGRIGEDDGLREAAHFLQAAEVLVELGVFLAEKGDFLLRKLVPGAVGLGGVEVAETLDAARDGAPVGEGAAEPAVGDVEGARADRFVDDDLLGLRLGADEEDLSARFDDGLEGLVSEDGALNRLVEIDDVDAVAGAVDVFAHLRVPAVGLVSEVDAGFQALLHRDDGSVGIVEDFSHGRLGASSRGRGFFDRDGFLDFVTHSGDLHLFMPPSLRTTDHLTAF